MKKIVSKNKHRTHKGASKRFKVSGTGMLLHVPHKSRHKLSKLTGSQRRRKRGMKVVEGRSAIKVKKILGLC